MNLNDLTNSSIDHEERGKGGEGGDFHITNAEFIAAVFPHLTEVAFAAVCSKGGDPSLGGWAKTQSNSSEHPSTARRCEVSRFNITDRSAGMAELVAA